VHLPVGVHDASRAPCAGQKSAYRLTAPYGQHRTRGEGRAVGSQPDCPSHPGEGAPRPWAVSSNPWRRAFRGEEAGWQPGLAGACLCLPGHYSTRRPLAQELGPVEPPSGGGSLIRSNDHVGGDHRVGRPHATQAAYSAISRGTCPGRCGVRRRFAAPARRAYNPQDRSRASCSKPRPFFVPLVRPSAPRPRDGLFPVIGGASVACLAPRAPNGRLAVFGSPRAKTPTRFRHRQTSRSHLVPMLGAAPFRDGRAVPLPRSPREHKTVAPARTSVSATYGNRAAWGMTASIASPPGGCCIQSHARRSDSVIRRRRLTR
jgi:hypothetical protein